MGMFDARPITNIKIYKNSKAIPNSLFNPIMAPKIVGGIADTPKLIPQNKIVDANGRLSRLSGGLRRRINA